MKEFKDLAKILGMVIELCRDKCVTYEVEDNMSKSYYTVTFTYSKYGTDKYTCYVLWYYDDEDFDTAKAIEDLEEVKDKIDKFKALNL